MKFNRYWLILGIGILTVIFAVLYLSYSKQSQEQALLFLEISQTQQSLSKITAEKHSLEPQLTQLEEKMTLAKAALNKSKASYPAYVESIDYSNELSDIADECALQVTILAASEAKEEKEKESGIIYLTTRFEIQVQGEVQDLLDFVHIIAQSESFKGTSIESLDITEMDKEEPSLRLSLVAYSYKGD